MLAQCCRVILVLSALSVGGPPTAESWKIIRPDGIGPAKVGMSLAQLNAATNEKFAFSPEIGEEQDCFFVDSKRHSGVSFMIEGGRLTRIDLDRPGIVSALGIRVGDSERQVIAAYGNQLTIEPNAYTGPDDHVLTYSSADRKYGIKFIMEKRRVRVIYAGLSDSISYIEGCE